MAKNNNHTNVATSTFAGFRNFHRFSSPYRLCQLLISGFDLAPYQPVVVKTASITSITGFDIRYWSTVVFRLGKTDNRAVKCSAIPCSDYKTTKMVSAGENQLRAAIKLHLQQGTACFHFAVQKQTDPESMLIEDASVIWDEEVSPF